MRSELQRLRREHRSPSLVFLQGIIGHVLLPLEVVAGTVVEVGGCHVLQARNALELLTQSFFDLASFRNQTV